VLQLNISVIAFEAPMFFSFCILIYRSFTSLQIESVLNGSKTHFAVLAICFPEDMDYICGFILLRIYVAHAQTRYIDTIRHGYTNTQS